MKPAPPVIRNARCLLTEPRIVVAIAWGAFGDSFWMYFRIKRSISSFLRAVAVGIRIVAIRIVVVRGAGIDGVQHDAEEAAFHADEQIAGAREGFLGCFTAAHDEQNAVGLHGQE